jgi:large subunit ribosomal protein L5
MTDTCKDLKSFYHEVVQPKLQQQLSCNLMAVPKIEKVTLNMGLGGAVTDKKIIKAAIDEMTSIAGQKAVPTLAKKSVAGFKIREGYPIGCKVTLRKDKMYQFLLKLVNFALPRVRDFRGLNPSSFDGRGNYSLGVKELFIFPEIDFDKVAQVRGMDIVITTSAANNQDAYCLLKELGFPLKPNKTSTKSSNKREGDQ